MKHVNRAYYAIFLRDDLPRVIEALYIKATKDINLLLASCRFYGNFQVVHLLASEPEKLHPSETMLHLHDWKRHARAVFRVEDVNAGVFVAVSGNGYVPFLKELAPSFTDFSTIPQLAVTTRGFLQDMHEEEK